MYQKQQMIGVIGMGVMGRNLALNIENCGYNVSIYNRSRQKTDSVITNNPNKNIFPYYSIQEFALSLNTPRIIFLMITSGKNVDHIIQILLPYLCKQDILIDGGNSFYKDTMRRQIELSKKEINFIGLGISGGEKGALYGPSLMPGGEKKVYKYIEPILKKISARIDDIICTTYIGPNGSGHYVKMIHNGIEYGDMQLIAEVYFFLKKVFCSTTEELSAIFAQWNQGELNSYLMEITSRILVKQDNDGNYIIDYVQDIADNKGTGMWAMCDALELGIPSNIISESIFTRYISVFKKQRHIASKILLGPENKDSFLDMSVFLEKIRKALYFSKIILYAQGFYQLKIASDKYCWNLNYQEISKIFCSGSIIRSNLLKEIIRIYSNDPNITNILLSNYCVYIANNYQQMLRDVMILSIRYGIPVPALSSAMMYYDSFRCEVLPTNLIQAQRDCFGAHTYSRVDQTGVFHTEWV